jgi:hypothetical protein
MAGSWRKLNYLKLRNHIYLNSQNFSIRTISATLNLKQSVSLGQIGWEIPESGNISLDHLI